MPYAGQYVLGGRLSTLNPYRSILPYESVLNKINESGVTQAISLDVFEEIDFNKQISGNGWTQRHNLFRDQYIKKISDKLYPYEKTDKITIESDSEIEFSLKRVKHEFESYILAGGIGSNSSITIKSDCFVKTINFGKNNCSISNEKPEFENHTLIELDARLLKRIISRKKGYTGFTQYHFNQAEIGSHMRWTRIGNYPIETQFLNFMQNII